MRPTLTLFLSLAGLRYRLIWAQARTSAGRVALLLSLYALGVLVAVFLAFGGIGSAVVAVQAGRAEQLARAVFGSVLAAGIATGLSFGIGPRSAFADRALRRYPLTAAHRFAARHFVGILDPEWPLLAALALGFSIGLAVLGVCSPFPAIAAALLFIAAVYLITALLLTLIDRVMEFRGGQALLSIFLLLCLAAFGFLFPLATRPGAHSWVSALGHLVDFTPAATAAGALVEARPAFRTLDFVMLAGWAVLLYEALRLAENWVVQRSAGKSADVPFDTPLDALARRIDPANAPLVAKALRYNLRCNRVRYQLSMSLPTLLLVNFLLAGQYAGGRGVAALAYLFFAGVFATLATTVNQFGYDDAGVRRYSLLPGSLRAALRAHSRASLFLSACVLVPAVALWCFLNRSVLDVRAVVFVACDAIGGLLLFHTAGLWASVLWPKRANFTRVLGNDMSWGGNMVMIAGILIITVAAPLSMNFMLAQLTAYWWLMGSVALAGALLYAGSLRAAGHVAESRRETLVGEIAGATQN